MRKKFKIMYPVRYEADPSLSGKQYESSGMVFMNSEGVFFEIITDGFYTHIRKLSDVLPIYDVCWKDWGGVMTEKEQSIYNQVFDLMRVVASIPTDVGDIEHQDLLGTVENKLESILMELNEGKLL